MAMIDHVSIGVADIQRGKSFYDACLEPLGYTCLSASETSVGYGKDAVAFWINLSPHPVAEDRESGLHFCFTAPTRKSVDAFHRAALAARGRDNGNRGSGRTTATTITPRSSSIRTAIASRPIAIARPDFARDAVLRATHDHEPAMATLRKEIFTRADPDDVWDAIRDIGALHTRLVPGFVLDTRLEPGARVVTFANGMVIREPIVAIDDAARRLVWAAEGGPMTHYNASAQALAAPGMTTVVWIADFLPDSATDFIRAAMDEGAAAMQAALDRLARARAGD